MSIKYLQDQQLNQVQQSPIDSPWAKLVAQSELLERNKMRQPQGQVPQGTVAGNIQQQLAAAQQQESEKQNVDLQKAQLLAQLIGSGHLPASFASQGYADGGLTQSSMQPGTGAYRGIMMPNQLPQMQGQRPTYVPPDSQDPAAQEKKHGLIQSMLDNSIVGMAQGKANIGNAMQDYADLFSGKIFSRGFAEGGDLYAFDNSTGTRAQQLARMRANLAAGYNPYMPDEGGETRAQQLARMKASLSAQDLANEPFRRAAEARAAKLRAIQEQAAGARRTLPAPGPYSQSSLESVLGKNTNIQDFIDSLNAKQAAANATVRPQEIPTAPQVKALPHIAQVSESPELQEYYKSLYGPKPEVTRGDVLSQLGKTNAPGEAQMRIPTREDMLRQTQGVTTGTDPLAEFKNRMYGGAPSALDAPRSNLMGTLLNLAEQKEALANQPKPSMTEKLREAGMAGYNDSTILDTMANKMSAADRINAANKPSAPVEPAAPDAWSGTEAGKGLGEELKGVGQGIAGLFKGPASVAGKALRAVSPVGDIMAVNDIIGSPLPMLAKAAGVNAPSSIGGVPVSQGGPSQLAMDLMGSPTARLNRAGSSISDAAQYVGDKATSAYDQFKNRLNTPPSVPQTDISQMADLYNEAAIPQQPTIGDFSGSATPQTPQAQTPQQGVRKAENGVIVNSKSANKAPATNENVQVRDKVFNQGPTTNTAEGHPVGDAAARSAALFQTDQAVNKSSDTGMGQGSILDSLYSKLKDTDVDYSDLAKRISQNEYDLARERKDGTTNAILGGIGAALTQAGTYQTAGDRVFKPGLGAIAGAGILGGLKMSAASDEAIDKKQHENMASMLALKKLKGDSLNNVLDAISAQKQVDATLRSQGITAQHYADVARHQSTTEEQENKKIDILGKTAAINAAHTNAEIAELAARNPNQKAAIELAQTKANNAEHNLASVRSGAHMPDDPSVMAAQKEYDNAMATLNYLLQSLKVPVSPAGSASPVRGPNDITVISRERI